ncbi:MAG: transposase [bacterium]
MRPDFDRRVKLEFHGARVSSDGGLLPYRDLNEACSLTDSSAAQVFDFRIGCNFRHGLAALLWQSIYSRLAGYEDVNDAERLGVDPVMRHVVGARAV